MNRWLLIRRPLNRDEAGDRAYYLCAAHRGASPQDLATAAGKRWTIETCFQTAKQETGLDEYEVRIWHGWHRHVTLSMLAPRKFGLPRRRAGRSRTAEPR